MEESNRGASGTNDKEDSYYLFSTPTEDQHSLMLKLLLRDWHHFHLSSSSTRDEFHYWKLEREIIKVVQQTLKLNMNVSKCNLHVLPRSRNNCSKESKEREKRLDPNQAGEIRPHFHFKSFFSVETIPANVPVEPDTTRNGAINLVDKSPNKETAFRSGLKQTFSGSLSVCVKSYLRDQKMIPGEFCE